MTGKTIYIILYLLTYQLSANPISNHWITLRLSNNEPVNFSVIDSIGTLNLSYGKDTVFNKHLQYYFTSHVNSKATVFISDYSDNTVAIYLDSAEDASQFSFTNALDTELKWLKNAGIIDLEDSVINHITEALKELGNGSAGVYDTKSGTADVLEGAAEVPSIESLPDTLKTALGYTPDRYGNSRYTMGITTRVKPDSYLISGKRVRPSSSQATLYRIDISDEKQHAYLHLNCTTLSRRTKTR